MNAPLRPATFEPQPDREIRIADAGDRSCVIELCRRLREEGGAPPLAIPEVERLVDRGLARERAVLPVIGERDDLRAMMLLIVDEIYYPDDYWLAEIWNYVRPDSRISAYGRQLLRFAIECADRSGLELSASIVANDRLDGKLRMYERFLGAPRCVFAYRPKVLT
jgi:GNAT superfamily N-acetyltransferase